MEAASDPVEGRAYRAGTRLLVLRLPLPTSLPIPLGVAAPPGLALVTWVFAGLKPSEAEGPRVLLLLAAEDEAASALAAGTRFTVATHFRDLAVDAEPGGTLDDLPAGERALVARAALSGVAACHVSALADLVGAIPSEATVPAQDAAEIAFHVKTRACVIASSDVPNFLLFRANAAWSCHRVARARVATAEPARADLDIEAVWGGPPAETPDAAIGLFTSRFAALRLATG